MPATVFLVSGCVLSNLPGFHFFSLAVSFEFFFYDSLYSSAGSLDGALMGKS